MKLILKDFPLEYAINSIVFQDRFARTEESFLPGSASLGAYVHRFWNYRAL